jgi:hypothetical protein
MKTSLSTARAGFWAARLGCCGMLLKRAGRRPPKTDEPPPKCGETPGFDLRDDPDRREDRKAECGAMP